MTGESKQKREQTLPYGNSAEPASSAWCSLEPPAPTTVAETRERRQYQPCPVKCEQIGAVRGVGGFRREVKTWDDSERRETHGMVVGSDEGYQESSSEWRERQHAVTPHMDGGNDSNAFVVISLLDRSTLMRWTFDRFFRHAALRRECDQ